MLATIPVQEHIRLMRRPGVLVTSPLPGQSENLLAGLFIISQNHGDALSAQELASQAQNKDAIVCDLTDRISENFLTQCPDLKIVANVAVGYDNIDIEAASRKGVLVTNTPGVLDDTTADLAFALLLALARRLPEASQYLREGQWKKFQLDLLFGVDVHHKTLGIIGMGRIGQAVARRARGFSMRTLYSQRQRLSPEIESELGADYVSLEELLKEADFISLHCPSNKETFHLLGEKEFQLMKPGCQLINTARGAVVDEKALIEALAQERIAGAALDVFENEPFVSQELLKSKNLLAVPHIGSATKETRIAMARTAVTGVDSAFRGIKPNNLVNEECWPEFLKKLNLINT